MLTGGYGGLLAVGGAVSIVNWAGKYEQYSDGVHYGDEFKRAYLAYLKRTLTWPWDDAEEKSIAFLFGVVSHNAADQPFHGEEDFEGHGYLQEARQWWRDFKDPFDAHFTIEMGVDAFNIRDDYGWLLLVGKKYPVPQWYFPAEAILATYVIQMFSTVPN